MHINDIDLSAIEKALEHAQKRAIAKSDNPTHYADAIAACERTREGVATDLELDAARDLRLIDVTIDDDAGTSHADDGVWVQAWVWVPNSDLGIEDEGDA